VFWIYIKIYLDDHNPTYFHAEYQEKLIDNWHKVVALESLFSISGADND